MKVPQVAMVSLLFSVSIQAMTVSATHFTSPFVSVNHPSATIFPLIFCGFASFKTRNWDCLTWDGPQSSVALHFSDHLDAWLKWIIRSSVMF